MAKVKSAGKCVETRRDREQDVFRKSMPVMVPFKGREGNVSCWALENAPWLLQEAGCVPVL